MTTIQTSNRNKYHNLLYLPSNTMHVFHSLRCGDALQTGNQCKFKEYVCNFYYKTGQ